MPGGSWKRGNLAFLSLFKVIQPLPSRSPLAPKLSHHRNYSLTVFTQRWYQAFPRSSQNLKLCGELSARPDCSFSPWLLWPLPVPLLHMESRAEQVPLSYCFAWELQAFPSAGAEFHCLKEAAVVFSLHRTRINSPLANKAAEFPLLTQTFWQSLL